MDVDAVTWGAEGEHACRPVRRKPGCIEPCSALSTSVYRPWRREVLDREQTAAGMEDIGVLAAASRHVEAAGAGDELVVAGIGGDDGLARCRR